MIRHKLFSKGERIHALISNTRHSHIVFPVYAVIHDVKFDEDIPRYQIRITKFHDNIDFLKRYLFGMKFSKDFNNRTTSFALTRKNYKSMKDFIRNLYVEYMNNPKMTLSVTIHIKLSFRK